MIISHKHKYLFIEVPQTASTAISTELRKHYGGEPVLHKHANYSQCRRLWPQVRDQYFKFAAVRNPMDQAVSYYLKLKNDHGGSYTNPKNFLRNGGWVPDIQLEHYDFVARDDVDFAAFFETFYRRMFHEWVLLGHREFDFIMRFENIQRDFEAVLQRLSLQMVRPLPVVNATGPKKPFLDYYPASIRDIVVDYMNPFMQDWGYALPDRWVDMPAPKLAHVRFAAIERVANYLDRFLFLNPRSPRLKAARTILRRLRL